MSVVSTLSVLPFLSSLRGISVILLGVELVIDGFLL